MPLTPGQILQNRYRIISLLGQGGMGAVYRAWDTRLGVPVAIKEMVPQPGLDSQTLAQLRQQFQREAMVLARLIHPNLVRVTDFFEEGGNAYLVMDFVEGQSLADLIAARGPLPEAQVLDWARQLLDALAYCHSQGVIHRDIKPQNIIIRSDGRPVLVDFGLVKLWDPRDPRTRTVVRGMGTPEYAPPEQWGAGHTDPRSDLYSLGATLYYALTGQAPATATDRIAAPTLFAPPRAFNPSIRPQTEAALLRAMELAQDRRWPSAVEMARGLGLPVPAWPSAPTPPREPTRQMPISAGVSGVAAGAPAAGIPAVARPIPARRVPGWLIAVLAAGGVMACALALLGLYVYQQSTIGQQMVAATAQAALDAAAATSQAVQTADARSTLQAGETATAQVLLTATREGQETATAVAGATRQAGARTATATARAVPTATPRLTATPAARPTTTSAPRPTVTVTPGEPVTPSPGPTPGASESAGGVWGFEQEIRWRRGDQPYGQISYSSEQVHSGNYAAKIQYDFPAVADNFVVFLPSPSLSLPGQPTGLLAWVYGNGSGHFFNVWLRDAAGEVRAYTFGRIYHQGWQQMLAWFDDARGWPNGHISGPDNGVLDYPVQLYALVVDGVPDGQASSGAIYVDEIRLTAQPIPQPTPTPEPPPPPPTAEPPPPPPTAEPPPPPPTATYGAVLPSVPETDRVAWTVGILAAGMLLGTLLVEDRPLRWTKGQRKSSRRRPLSG
jgi:tRNA A-37 threonylcarbamoyl transferase component Bud32